MRERVIDALEEKAVAAWRDACERALDEQIGERGEAFVDRVMAAEQPLFVVEAASVVLDPPPPLPRWRRAAGIRVFAAMVITGAGGIAAVLSYGEVPEPVPAQHASPRTEARVAEAPGAPLLGVFTPGSRLEGTLPPEGTPGRPFPADLEPKILRYIEGYGRNWGPTFRFHGVIVVARDGEVAFARGFGVARPGTGTPNGPGTRFRIGMLTEQFTAAAILRLRDEGKLALHDPVAKFFRGPSGPEWLPAFPHAQDITVEQLLAHTSGLPNYTETPGFHVWKAVPHTTDQMLARIVSTPGSRHGWMGLEFDPGTAFDPSNSGYFVLGAIIERVTGLSYGEALDQLFFTPAGMQATTYGDAYDTGEQARGNVWNDEEGLDPPDPIDMSVFGGAAGLVSSALDLVKWDRVLHDGELLSRESAAAMVAPGPSGYGYGYTVSEGYGQRVAMFPGLIDGFNGAMLRFLEDRTVIVVLSNNEVVPGLRVGHDIAAIAHGDDPPERTEHAEVDIAPGTLSRFVGTYALSGATRSRYAGRVEPERLALLAQVHVRRTGDRLELDVPGHGRSRMHPMGQNRFFFKDHSGSTIRFELGDDKSALRLVLEYPDGELVLERTP